MVLVLSSGPLFLLIVLILFLFFVSLILALVLENYLFAYLVFLLFIRGLIIILMYFCRVILREKYLVYTDMWFLVRFLCILIGLSINYYKFFSDFQEKIKSLYFEFYGLLKYTFVYYRVYSLFFIGYLFICLIVVYEIVSRCGGPLRIKI